MPLLLLYSFVAGVVAQPMNCGGSSRGVGLTNMPASLELPPVSSNELQRYTDLLSERLVLYTSVSAQSTFTSTVIAWQTWVA